MTLNPKIARFDPNYNDDIQTNDKIKGGYYMTRPLNPKCIHLDSMMQIFTIHIRARNFGSKDTLGKSESIKLLISIYSTPNIYDLVKPIAMCLMDDLILFVFIRVGEDIL